MTPREWADSLRELIAEIKDDLDVMAIHLADLRKLADSVAALSDDPRWLLYPLDLVYPVSGEFLTLYTIGGKTWRHEGLDLACPTGCAVHACGAGSVSYAGWRDGYGSCVVIEHSRAGEAWHTWYGHLSHVNVLAGHPVMANQVIGFSGATGNVTGAHLHLTVQRASSTFKPEGCAETLRGVVDPRLFVQGLGGAA